MSSAAPTPPSLRPVASQASQSPLARRLAIIDRYSILDTPREAEFDDLTALAASLCDTSFAAISFVDAERQWFKAETGLGVRETPIDQSFCAHAIREDGMFVIPDATADERFAANPLVTGEPHLRFYAGVPLCAADGTPFAALCVLDRAARPGGLTAQQSETLRVLARQVETQLELRRSIIERDQHAAEQQSMTERLRWMASHDVLTALPNRALFQMRLGAVLDGGEPVTLMILDVDHFKQVNDTAGHDGGDAVLCAVADRLRECARGHDTVARLGGDEFAVVMPGLGEGPILRAQITRMMLRLRDPVSRDVRAADCRVSAGVAVAPGHAANMESLVKYADLALGAAKAAGRDRAMIFDPAMLADHRHERLMLRHAREAIARDQIVPYYQPKVDLRTGAVAGFEALLRWNAPGGPLPPSTLDPAFADRELSVAMSALMLDRVLADMRGWIAGGIDFGHVALNCCAADFAHDDFAEHLLAALGRSGVPPMMMQVEVTESVFLGRGSSHVERAMAALSGAGVRVALDDFGTGFASLTHLKQFTIDVLKIDRSFVAGIERAGDDAAIVRAVIGLGNGLGIETVAEGIETQAQADYVRDCGCMLGQGFLFGAARPADAVPEMLRAATQPPY